MIKIFAFSDVESDSFLQDDFRDGRDKKARGM